jgi:hypothetical protein
VITVAKRLVLRENAISAQLELNVMEAATFSPLSWDLFGSNRSLKLSQRIGWSRAPQGMCLCAAQTDQKMTNV